MRKATTCSLKPAEGKGKNHGPDFHSVENNQQVPWWSGTLAAMERIVWKDLGSSGKVAGKKSEDVV